MSQPANTQQQSLSEGVQGAVSREARMTAAPYACLL